MAVWGSEGSITWDAVALDGCGLPKASITILAEAERLRQLTANIRGSERAEDHHPRDMAIQAAVVALRLGGHLSDKRLVSTPGSPPTLSAKQSYA